MTVSVDSTKSSRMGVMLIVLEAEPLGMVTLLPMVV